jgi:hypothetical protein
MEGARHLVVEGPDGSVAIAFNQEIPPPVIVELPEEPQTLTRFRFDVVEVKYNKSVQICFRLTLLISFVKLFNLLRIIDIIDFIFIIASTIAVHSERPISIAPISGHGMYLITILPVITFSRRWWDLSYIMVCAVLCGASLTTMNNTLIQIPV